MSVDAPVPSGCFIAMRVATFADSSEAISCVRAASPFRLKPHAEREAVAV